MQVLVRLVAVSPNSREERLDSGVEYIPSPARSWLVANIFVNVEVAAVAPCPRVVKTFSVPSACKRRIEPSEDMVMWRDPPDL